MMNLFLGYGYNERDQWIEDWVIPLVQAFDFRVQTGKGLEGESLGDGVKGRIRTARAALGFATRRELMDNGAWTTHRWVTDELAFADANHLRTLEVREHGVGSQAGLRDGIGRLDFRTEERERLLVDLARVLSRWRRELTQVRLQLLPAEIQRKIIPIYRQPDFRCTYRLMIEAEESEPFPAKIVPFKGGLFIELREVPPNAAVQVEIACGGRGLTSGFEAVDSVGVVLQGDL